MSREKWNELVEDAKEFGDCFAIIWADSRIRELEGELSNLSGEMQTNWVPQWMHDRVVEGNKQLREAVEWALAELAHIEVPWIRDELRRRAGRDGGGN